MSLFGLGSNKEKSWIDDKTSGAQWANYNGAQQLPGSYSPTSAGLIGQYMNPYTDQVVNKSLDALERSRQMAINNTGDQAMAAHAFGGSRHGVAQALTNQDYANQAGLLSSQLYNQGYGQALDAAQRENALSYQYPLSRQQTLNSTLSLVRPMTVGKQQDPGAAMSNFGGLLNTAGNLAAFFGM